MNIILFAYQYVYVFMIHSSVYLFARVKAGKKNKKEGVLGSDTHTWKK